VTAERRKARTAVAALLRVTAVMIDWSIAVVKPKGRHVEPTVRLTAHGRRHAGPEGPGEVGQEMTERFRSPG
jgi:hypothetical protein